MSLEKFMKMPKPDPQIAEIRRLKDAEKLKKHGEWARKYGEEK